jgi:signal transduction histidine kinase
VRKLNIRHEIEEAIRVALPDGVFPGVRVEYLTPVPADLHLLIQPRHLSEILVNLLVNAREAMQSDGTIRISAGRNSETSIFISISDTGPGVPPEHQNRIFEAFFSTKEQGTGIGLGIVKKYVELYSGRITLDSSPRGSSFTLVFPEKLSIAPTK